MIGNKSWFVLVKVDTGKKFKIHIPLPLYVFTELFYSLEGLMLLLDLALPRLMSMKAYDNVFGSRFGFYKTIHAVNDMFEALQESGSFSLVDIDADDAKISIKFV